MRAATWAARRQCSMVAVMGVLAVVLGLAPTALAGSGGPVAGAARVGPAPARQPITLALPLRADLAGLERFAAAVSTPGSPQYGRYESISALAGRFGASSSERTRVLRFLRRAGATASAIDATGLYARATFTVSKAQRLFGTTLATFMTARATRFVSPATAARIPAGLRDAVTGVVGLDTRPIVGTGWARASAPFPSAAARPASLTRAQEGLSGYQDRTGTASGCPAATSQTGFTPNQYLSAYGYTPLQQSGISGQGERVALIEIDGFRYTDIRSFAECFGLPTPAIKGFLVGLKRPLAPGGESTLDLEVLNAAAPGLRQIDVYESGATAVDVLTSLTAPLDNRGYKPDVISASLGACESATIDEIGRPGLRAVEGALELAAASGISILASSGDDGSSACVSQAGKPLPTLAVSYPASSPWVTGVGGTNFTLNGDNTIASQDVWNDAPVALAAGGGGSSILFTRPSYQDTFQDSNDCAPLPTCRTVPDVSMLADIAPGYEIFCTVRDECVNQTSPGPWTQVGGTSAAAPLLAGGLALVDQDLREHGRQDLGLANPLLYRIDRLPAGAQVISAVPTGDNDLGASIDGTPLGCCTAGAGYSLASGLGSVNISALASTVSGLVAPIVSVGLILPGQHAPVAARRLLARVSCSGRCLMGAYAQIVVGRSRKLITDYSSVYLLRNGGSKAIGIPFGTGDLSRLRAALSAGTPITATVYGAVLDPGGNIERATRGQRLRITG